MPGLAIAAIAFGTVFAAELPDNSGIAALVLGTRHRAAWVFTGVAAAFAVHVILAIVAGSLFGLLPHRIVQIVVAVVFLAGAVVLLRETREGDEEGDEDGKRPAGSGTGFFRVAAASFAVIAIAELGDLSDVVIANLAARYHDPVAVGVGSVLALWAAAAVAIIGGRGLVRIIPLQWIGRLAALAMVVMAGFSIAEAIR
jgi:Ca2+/H+ antiporter, TMEM165/GDT1 family